MQRTLEKPKNVLIKGVSIPQCASLKEIYRISESLNGVTKIFKIIAVAQINNDHDKCIFYASFEKDQLKVTILQEEMFQFLEKKNKVFIDTHGVHQKLAYVNLINVLEKYSISQSEEKQIKRSAQSFEIDINRAIGQQIYNLAIRNPSFGKLLYRKPI